MDGRPVMRKFFAILAAFAGWGAAANAETVETRVMRHSFKPLAEGFFVSPQIAPADVETVKEAGVTLIINNRPDGEEPGQPTSAEIEAAAKAAGIAYVEIPVSGMNISPAHLDAFDAAVNGTEGPVLAFCRSGTRSTVLRSFARARAGDSADQIINEAAEAGYNIAGQRGALIALGAK